MNELNQMSKEDNVLETPEGDERKWAVEPMPAHGSESLQTEHNRQELITVGETVRIDKWRVIIEKAWGKTIEDVINLGRLLNQAKAELGVNYKELEKRLSFSPGKITMLTRIADHAVLSNPNNSSKLPFGYNTLYQLSLVQDQILEEKIKTGDITPKLTLSEAKTLRMQSEGQSSSNVKDQAVPSYDVGKIRISVVTDLSSFQDELHQLIAKYQGSMSYSTNDKSIAEYHRKRLHTQASNEVKTLDSGIIRKISALDEVILYLLDKNTQKTKGTGTERKFSHIKPRFLPPNHPRYSDVNKLLKKDDIDLMGIEQWSRQNNIPNSLINPSEINSDVYVWYLVQQITDKNPNRMAKKRLEDIATDCIAENIKELAQTQLAAIKRFEGYQGLKNAPT